MALHQRTVRWSGGVVNVVEADNPAGSPILFLHGWPQCAHAWRRVMSLAGDRRVVAIDLPGIGASPGVVAGGSKQAMAEAIHEVVKALGLNAFTLVGHDIGGMIVFNYLRGYPEQLNRAVIMNTVIPGVDPWEDVKRNPYIWHFAFQTIPDLPELLVQGRQLPYFGYFFDRLSPDPSTVTDEARSVYAQAYSDPAALTAGFDWYRSFEKDAVDNARHVAIDVPLLYVRGEKEGGDAAVYAAGLRATGLSNVTFATIPNAGHFAPEDTPEDVWRLVNGG